jgi:hypothetical protein
MNGFCTEERLGSVTELFNEANNKQMLNKKNPSHKAYFVTVLRPLTSD